MVLVPPDTADGGGGGDVICPQRGQGSRALKWTRGSPVIPGEPAGPSPAPPPRAGPGGAGRPLLGRGTTPPLPSGGVSVTGARFRGLHLGPRPCPEGAGGGQHASEARTQETTSPKATPQEWARGQQLRSRQERPQLPAIPAGGPQGLMGEPGPHQDPHPVHVPRMWGRGVTLPPGRRQELA